MLKTESSDTSIRKTFTARCGEISYLEWSSSPTDAPLIHFAHANGFNANTYRGLLTPLSDRVRILASDFRGHGFTALPADPQYLNSWDVYRDDLIEFLEHQREAAFLVGHSLGGVVSLLVAATRPDLVRGLILLDPVMLPYRILALWLPVKLIGLGGRLPIARRAAHRSSVWSGLDEVLASYRGRGAFTTWQDGFLYDYLTGGTRTRPDGRIELTCNPQWESRSFAAVSHNIWLRARKVTCPTLLLYGGRSDTFTAASAGQFRKTFSKAQMICFEDATHFLPMEQPERVRNAILSMTG